MCDTEYVQDCDGGGYQVMLMIQDGDADDAVNDRLVIWDDDESSELMMPMITSIIPEHLWGTSSVRHSAQASLPTGLY